jgi:hypothetical protein
MPQYDHSMTSKESDIDIVQVIVADGGAIGECCKVGCDAPVGANDARGVAHVRKRDITANAYRILIKRRDPAP